MSLTGDNRREANLKLWVAAVAYAAGIAFGEKAVPVSSPQIGTAAGAGVAAGTGSVVAISAFIIAGVVIAAAVLFYLFWALKRSNPRYGLAHGLLIVIFLAAGLTTGLSLAVGAGGNSQAGAKANKAASKTQNSAGYDTEKIPVIKAVRQHIKGTINKTLSERYRGLMMGIILGETKDIPTDMATDFKTTGLSHILAVSGLNISILIIAFGYIVRAATMNMEKRGRYLAFAVTVGAVVFYMFLTKLQPSVVRAGVMGVAALVAVLVSRPGNPFPALAAAAMAILVVDPAALFNIGFQLSFAATIAILVFTPLLETAFKAGPRGLAAAASLTMAAQLGVAPLLILYFGRLSVISIAANVIAGPAIVPATILGIVISVSGVISTGLARIVAIITEPCLAYISGVANYFAGWPYASLSLPPVSAWHIVAYYLLIGLLYLALTKYNLWQSTRATINDFPSRRFARTATASILLAALIIGLFGCQAANSQPPAGLRTIFIDVGQGDATIIQAEDGATILVDGGPEPDSAVTALRDYGIKAIDLMIVTHGHADHASGLETVVNGYFVKKAIVPPESSSRSLAGKIISALDRKGVSEKVAEQGQSYKVGKYLEVSILSPDQTILNTTSADESDDANNRAIVALIQYKRVRMMFTGDIEMSTEEAMVNDGEAGHVDVLKVPHHGSKNGADARFINAVRPEIAVISVGLNNPFHHPAPSTVAKLKQAGAIVYRTDKNGSVIIESDGSSIHVSTSK